MKTHLILFTCFAFLTNPLPAVAAGTDGLPSIPDFTQGDEPGKAHDWTLGPTGARGWIHTANGHSREARQILVTAVAEGSPADGTLAAGDVILGVEGKPFSADARVEFAQAVANAESEGGGGRLELLRWRGGVTKPLTLALPVLGRYAETAPYGCPKSKRIVDVGCAALARRMAAPGYAKGLDPIPRSLNALALLASGQQEHLPLLGKEAHWAAEFTTDGYLSWYYGYLMMFLAEYVMITGDDTVRSGLERLALETARGQSGVGTWGHRFAQPGGNLGGYGAMNAPGLSLTIGMVLAREAGVNHADLDAAIAKSAAFLRWFVNKGAIPYGDHQPYFAHEDNGKCAAAAVLFDLLGDREAAEFFAKMSAAAYRERERGHTGNFFNMLWALSGVVRCGPLTSGAYLKEHSWYYDLARGWETKFVYQGSPVGEEESGAYRNWDCSGSYLLGFAMPRQRLRLTGRKPFTVPPLDAAQTAEVITAGGHFAYKGDENAYQHLSDDELLAGLASWSPFVRGRSAAALGKREGDFVPALLGMLDSTDLHSRYGAIEALGALGSRADDAAPQLRAALQNSDPWVQCLAALALPELGGEVRKASVGDLLALVVRSNPADPRRQAARYASFALFSPFPGTRNPPTILAESLEGVNRVELIPALQTLLTHEDSIARGAAGRTFARLGDEDLVALLPEIVQAIEKIAPSNEMFADGVRLAGLDLLSRLRLREGMALCVSVIEPERWGERNRSVACLAYLARYGAHAKSLLPEVRKTRAYLAQVKKVPADRLAELDKHIAAIESSTETPTLVALADFRSRSAGK